ncbi:electron transport complex subunit RsxC [Alteromonas sp. CYL-A6]|uniref:electron transport complex subunit RsxC n=1 Tax=Alteromonas nitratireducens TaxID=3390813 RepID=UPI0034B67E49
MLSPSFEHIIDLLNQGKTGTFPGGVHPDDKKALSNTTAITTPPLPDLITLPLRQHVGSEGTCLVEVGDVVKKGQPLTAGNNPYAVPVHAPTSGEVIAIAPHVIAHPSGLTEMCISIRPDGHDSWCELTPIADYQHVDKATLVEAICNAGISGMGGAGFPTHIKTSSSKPVEFLIINGVECEPYISADDRLMREHAWQIRQGIDILSHLVEPKAVIIAIEDNKPEAIEAMKVACQDKAAYRVVDVETKYPAGGEKQLIQVITGREVPRHGLPADVGVLMFNVGTAFAVADAIISGKPLIERVVTLTGDALTRPGNVWARLGTPVSHLLDYAGYHPGQQTSPRVIMGGPMMGFTLADVSIPVVKITNCLLVPAAHELADDDAERPCIRCSACADACPVSLLPQQMFWHAKAKEYDKAQDYNLFDCIECGACAYVCPSEIPLVHYYRQAKSAIRLERDERNKAEKAKQRFEARKARLEQEKQEREARHRRAQEARQKSASQAPAETKDKVAAALARAKAKKAAQADTAAPAPEDKKAQVAAAIARAKAKKAQRDETPSTPESVQTDSIQTESIQTESIQTESIQTESIQTESSQTETAQNDDKQARVAQAIARAKAKKAARENKADDSGQTTASAGSTDDEKQQKIAAAVARAKAKKAAAETTSDTESSKTTSSADDEKRQRIAAAVARAKAKKAAKTSDNNDESS